VVLDADSVMSGDCLTSMVKLMEANPTAGIIQTATQAIGHVTLHARAQQFASRVTGRLFTLGMQCWRLGASPYWGRNALPRLEPSLTICAVACIEATGGLSGGIVSHDCAEAALMRRAGYNVTRRPVTREANCCARACSVTWPMACVAVWMMPAVGLA